jgi:hypothetical protein
MLTFVKDNLMEFFLGFAAGVGIAILMSGAVVVYNILAHTPR